MRVLLIILVCYFLYRLLKPSKSPKKDSDGRTTIMTDDSSSDKPYRDKDVIDARYKDIEPKK